MSDIGRDLYVRTEYDGHDYRSVLEVFFYDEDGEEVVHQRATDLCLGIDTCADMGDETYDVLGQRVSAMLNANGIEFSSLTFQDD